MNYSEDASLAELYIAFPFLTRMTHIHVMAVPRPVFDIFRHCVQMMSLQSHALAYSPLEERHGAAGFLHPHARFLH